MVIHYFRSMPTASTKCINLENNEIRKKLGHTTLRYLAATDERYTEVDLPLHPAGQVGHDHVLLCHQVQHLDVFRRLGLRTTLYTSFGIRDIIQNLFS